MPLQMTYANEADIPSEYKALYTSANNVWTLTAVVGIKSQSDIDTVQEGLRKEREDHRATKTKLSAFGALNADDVYKKLDRIAELEAASGDKLDETKINELVETRINSRLAPVQRELDKANILVADSAKEIEVYKGKEVRRSIHDIVREAATANKVVASAIPDVLLIAENTFEINEQNKIVTRDNVGVTPGIDASVWLTETKQNRPHWFPVTKGAGGNGGNGGGNGGNGNPFSKEGWNLTEQGRLIIADRDNAEQMAKSAGTSIGAPMPT